MRNYVVFGLLCVSVLLGGWYVMLGLKARTHLSDDATPEDRSIGWLFWWSFDQSIYDEKGKRICKQGQLLAIALISLYAAWYFYFLH